MNLLFISALLASTYLVISLITYFISQKTIKTPELFDFKSMLLGFLGSFLVVYLFFNIILFFSDKDLTETTLSVIIFFGLALFPSYEYFIQPLLTLFSSRICRTYQFDDYSFLKGYKVYISNKDFTNAFALGAIPNTKSIIISEPLIKSMSTDELKAIVAHEAGHLKLNHIVKIYMVALLFLFLGFLSSIFIYPIIENYPPYIHILRGLHGGFLYALPTWIGTSVVQRKMEFQADKYAANITSKNHIISALIKLDQLSEGRVSKGGITHPTLRKRIININTLK